MPASKVPNKTCVLYVRSTNLCVCVCVHDVCPTALQVANQRHGNTVAVGASSSQNISQTACPLTAAPPRLPHSSAKQRRQTPPWISTWRRWVLLQSPNCTMGWRCALGKVRGSWSAAGTHGFHRSLHMHLGLATDSASANGAANTTDTDNDLTQLRHQLLRSEQRRNNLHHAFQRMRKRVAELEHEVQCLASVANNCTTHHPFAHAPIVYCPWFWNR